ncbi:MAG: allantoinase, partial [Gammaproteobacteria bacterium]|nr:allantoinase [Gammaproteobacteria bacterium]
SFDILYAEGETRPKMMTIGLHARLIGRPGRIGSLHKFLDYVLDHDRIWICRRDDLARYWSGNYPNRDA